MTPSDIDEIAQAAAKLYGQEWGNLPAHSRDIWREAARHDEPVRREPGAVQSDVERCAAEARKQWFDRQTPAPEPEPEAPVEKKPKIKKRGDE